jgi:hypothetical protein
LILPIQERFDPPIISTVADMLATWRKNLPALIQRFPAPQLREVWMVTGGLGTLIVELPFC